MKTPSELKLFNENVELRRKLSEAERISHNLDIVCQGAMLVFDAVRVRLCHADKQALDKLINVYKNDCK